MTNELIKSLTARIEELESRDAFQEFTIETLNSRIIEQQKELDLLKHHLLGLSEKFNALAREGSVQPGIERPPHY